MIIGTVKDNSSVGDFTAVYEVFTRARKHLKYPKVRLQTAAGRRIVLSMSGKGSRVPDTVNIATEGDFYERTWYGRVSRDGHWTKPGMGTPEDVVEIVAALAADVVDVATRYGRLTGNCCFCGLRLTDERSTVVGYGAICAAHFELPWGKRPEKPEPWSEAAAEGGAR